MATGQSEFGLRQIGQISVNIHDLDRAVAFYRDVLGMSLLFTVPPKLGFFDCSGVRLMLSLPEKPEFDHPGSILYYRVADIHQAATTLKSRGVTFESEPHLVAKLDRHDLYLGFFRDPDGNLLGLMSEVPR
jgi:methylmalonyl-CoA/ethylmalonyl-CoA epimerase